MAPEAHPEQAVVEGLAYPPQGPAAPAHRIAQRLKLDQVDRSLLAQHQPQLLVGGRADTVAWAVELRQQLGFLQARGDGGVRHGQHRLGRLSSLTILPETGSPGRRWGRRFLPLLSSLLPGDLPPPPLASPRRPLLVAVHGWLLSGRLWAPLQQALAPDWPLWCPDLPGFGAAPRPRGLAANLASYGRWLAEAVQRQAGEAPVVLVGHSLGGSVALHAAPLLGRQLVGVVQIAAGGGVYQPRAFARVRQGGSLFLRWRPGWLASQTWLPGIGALRSPLLADLHAARGLLACSMNRGAVTQLPRLTAQLTVPSLWIAGSRDTVMEPRYVRHLAGYAPDHQLEILAGVGHLPMQEQPGALAALLRAWLEEISATPAG